MSRPSNPGTPAVGQEAHEASAYAVVRLLQLGDSALPIGRYVHSLGLEALLDHDPSLGVVELAEVVQSFVMEGVARLDAVAVAEAHRLASRRDVAGLINLDRALTTRKLTPAGRRASQTCGSQLAVLAKSLASDPTLNSYCEALRSDSTDGNLAIVEGALSAALSVPCTWAVLMMLRGSAAGLLSASVRLGRLSATRAQRLLRECEPTIIRAAEDALSCSWPETFSGAFELEIHAMRHGRAESRLFMT